jgi:hypothetical protein
MVYLGDISYSLYLWHWPLIVFSRAIWPGTEIFVLLSVLLALIFSVFSYETIEVRRWGVFKKRQRFSSLAIGMLIVVTVLVGLASQKISNTGLGIPKVTSKWENIASSSGCELGTDLWESSCRFGNPINSFTAVLIGDSNARSASDGVVDAIEFLGGEVFVSHQSGCSALKVTIDSNCDEFNRKRFDAISERRPDLIILVNYQNYFTDNLETILADLKETLEFFAKMKIPVVVQGQIPECSESISIVRFKMFDVTSCKVPLSDQEKRNQLVSESERITLYYSRNSFVDPADELCSLSQCLSFFHDHWTYSDQKHLSPTGSKMLTATYVEAIKKVLEQKKN